MGIVPSNPKAMLSRPSGEFLLPGSIGWHGCGPGSEACVFNCLDDQRHIRRRSLGPPHRSPTRLQIHRRALHAGHGAQRLTNVPRAIATGHARHLQFGN